MVSAVVARGSRAAHGRTGRRCPAAPAGEGGDERAEEGVQPECQSWRRPVGTWASRRSSSNQVRNRRSITCLPAGASPQEVVGRRVPAGQEGDIVKLEFLVQIRPDQRQDGAADRLGERRPCGRHRREVRVGCTAGERRGVGRVGICVALGCRRSGRAWIRRAFGGRVEPPTGYSRKAVESAAPPARIPMAAAAAPIAQLDRASVYGTEGCRFDSCWVY
jgi:hypothetical protein